MKYRADIDGLRALAVASVVLFHAHAPGFTGGFVGVDIFFVISGYLICTIIVAEIRQGDFSMAGFYERRCRRILPPLFAMMLITWIACAFILLPPDMEKVSSSVIASTFFFSNVAFWRDANYFGGAAELKPLLHTWSLGVEEQFYIFMPFILLGTARLLNQRYLLWLGVLSGASLCLSIWGVTHAPTATFYLLPTRFWELAAGAIIGVGLQQPSLSKAASNMIGLAGLALVVWSATAFSENTPFPGAHAVIPVAGAACILYAGVGSGSMTSAFLSSRPLVFVGKLSYSFYLWHWPFLSLAKYRLSRELSGFETLGLVLLAFIAALLSWRFVERPFRAHSGKFTRNAIFAGTALAMLGATGAGATGVISGGFPSRFPEYVHVDIPGPEQMNRRTCFLMDDQSFREWRGASCFLTHGHEENVLLWGDSYAAHYAPGLMAKASGADANFLQYTASLCAPIFDYDTAARPNCREFNDNVRQVIGRYGIRTVLMAGKWAALFRRGVSPRQVADTVRQLNGLGVRVLVIGQTPVYANDVQVLLAQNATARNTGIAAAPLSFDAGINRSLAGILAPGVLIDPIPYLCHDQLCPYWRDQKFLVSDNGHLSAEGSAFAVQSYFPFFSRPQ